MGSVPTAAHAQGDASGDALARAHFQAGTELFQAADYERALTEYLQAYELSHRAALTYNLYLCLERLGRLAEAIHWLSRYLDEAPDGPRSEQLRVRLETMRRRLADSDRPAPPEPESSDEQLEDPSANPAPEPEAEPEPREPEPPELAPDPPPPAAAALAEPTNFPRVVEPSEFEVPAGAIVAYGVGGLGAVGLAVFGGLALAEDQRLADDCPTGCDASEAGDLRSYLIGADTSLAFGITGLLTGVVWTIVALATFEPTEQVTARAHR